MNYFIYILIYSILFYLNKLFYTNITLLSINFLNINHSLNEQNLIDNNNNIIKENNKIKSNNLYYLSKNGNNYKILKLKNDITVILTSTNNIIQYEISLINQVGSVYEPKEIEGLAFYLMNILLSASSLYNNNNYGLFDFSNNHSVKLIYNIYYTYSNYILLVSPDDFEKSLELIADMFKNLIINDEILEKALNLINKLIYFNPDSNSKMVWSIFSQKLSSPSHIASRNIFGDLNTLKFIPKSKNINIKSELIKFFNEQYSSNRLILSLKSNLDLNIMEQMVNKLFSNIKNKNLSIPNINKPFQIITQNPFIQSTKKIFYSLDNNINLLYLIFPSKNYLHPYIKSEPLFFIKYFLSNEREGSLFNYFLKKRWIEYMDIFINNELYGYSTIDFKISLLYEGVINLPIILKSIFASIKIIKNFDIDINYYNSFKNEIIEKINLNQHNIDNESYYLLNNYYKFNNKNINSILLGLHEYKDFDINLHKQIISELIPENLIIVLFTKNEYNINNKNTLSFNSTLNSQDCIAYKKLLDINNSFHYQYLTNINGQLNNKMQNIYDFEFLLSDFHPCLIYYLSKINQEFINNLPIKPPLIENYEQKKSIYLFKNNDNNLIPIKLKDLFINDYNKCSYNYNLFKHFYYYIPNKFLCNQIFITLNFLYPFHIKKWSLISTTKAYTLLHLLSELIKYYSNDLLKNINIKTKLSVSMFLPYYFIKNLFGITITLESYPELFLEIINIFQKVINIINNIDLNNFNNLINLIKRNIDNYIKSPENHDYLKFINNININHVITSELILLELTKLNIKDLYEFSSDIFNNSEIIGITYGNLSHFDAENYLCKLFEILGRTQKNNNILNIKNSYKNFERTKIKTTRLLTKIKSKTNSKKKLQDKKIMITNKRKKFKLTRSKKLLNNLTKQEKFNRSLPLIKKKYETISTKYIKSYSECISKIQLIDFSSLKYNTKLFYHVKSKKLNKKNISLLWILIDKITPESFVFSDVLKYILKNQISNYQVTNNSTEVLLTDYILSNTAIFISLEASSSNKSIKELNKELLDYWNIFFSPSSLSSIFNESLFNSSKKSLMNLFRSQDIYDEYLENINYEILNNRYDFTRYRSRKYLLNEMTFSIFLDNINKVWNRSTLILFSIEKLQSEIDNNLSNSLIDTPYDFINLIDIKDIFKIPGIRTFKPIILKDNE